MVERRRIDDPLFFDQGHAVSFDARISYFLNNFGRGYPFAAAGSVVYRKAKERRVGRELPTDWFTEDVHP